jgi:hypothetical protein
MFSWRRYLRGSLSPATFGPEDNSHAPHHRTECFNCILAPKHIANGRGEIIVVIVIHGVLVARSEKFLQLAKRFVIAQALHVTETGPEAGCRKNDL